MPDNKPLALFEELIREQGLKKSWVAEQAGLEIRGMRKRFLRKQGYSWQPGEREAIAKALRVPVAMIWPDDGER